VTRGDAARAALELVEAVVLGRRPLPPACDAEAVRAERIATSRALAELLGAADVLEQRALDLEALELEYRDV
jgi:hypothetical protein